jgi:hypothetical protein
VLQTHLQLHKCRKSRPSNKYSPACPCAKVCTSSSLPPLSGGLRVSGGYQRCWCLPVWCRCSNTVVRRISWFLGEVAFKLLLFLRAPSTSFVLRVAPSPVLVPPPPLTLPLVRASLATADADAAQLVLGGQWGAHHLCAVRCRTGGAPSVSLLPFVAVVRARSILCVVVGGAAAVV